MSVTAARSAPYEFSNMAHEDHRIFGKREIQVCKSKILSKLLPHDHAANFGRRRLQVRFLISNHADWIF